MAEQYTRRLVGNPTAWQSQERLTPAARRAVEWAEETAGARGLRRATPDLLLYALIIDDQTVPSRALLACGGDPAAIRSDLDRRSTSRADGGSERSPLSDAAREAVVLGVNEARRAGAEHAGTGHLLLGLLEEGTGAGVRSIKRQGVPLAALRDAVNSLTDEDENDVAYSAEVDQILAELLERVSTVLACPRCGITLPAGFNYCYRCGANLSLAHGL
jgi:ATP-dependent Clp protease ATP-binding subunit ClpA